MFCDGRGRSKRRNEQYVDPFVYRAKHEGPVLNVIGWTGDPLM